MSDFRALCAELYATFEKYGETLEEERLLDRVASALRAALAAEPQGPTDAELWALCFETGGDTRERDTIWPITYARAVLAHWGNTAPRPIPVTEGLRLLQAGIRSGYMAGHDATVEGRYGDPDEVAADLAPEVLRELDPRPIPITERLPGADDCQVDGEGDECCWYFLPETEDTLAVWVLFDTETALLREMKPTHWLPHHALPLPEVEG